jgi:hypothetical protein
MVIQNIIHFSFVANVNLSRNKSKNSGFGRCEYEALKNALLNLLEHLLDDEHYLNTVKECMKVFISIKSTLKRDVISYLNSIQMRKNIFSDKEEKNSIRNKADKAATAVLSVNHETSFEITRKNNTSNKELERINESIKEKDLIIIEMEKLIIDMVNYNKKIIDLLELESNQENMPNYFRCPISWEKMETPVVSMEGHS